MKSSNSFIEPIHRDVIKAAKEGDAQILRSLLQNNIPAHILINALCYSVSNAHLSCCRILLDKGVDINGVGLYSSTPLLTAAGKLNFEIADLLLKRGADVNARDDMGRTPLLVATLNFAGIDLLRLLLEAGADANIADNKGFTPLTKVVGRLNIESASMLLQYGADINAGNDIGRTPLLVAILNFADVDILRLLLEAGSDANIADNRGLTPLWATLLDNCNPDIMRLLLQYGADVRVTYFGKLPIDIARKNNLKMFEQILDTPRLLEHQPNKHVTP